MISEKWSKNVIEYKPFFPERYTVIKYKSNKIDILIDSSSLIQWLAITKNIIVFIPKVITINLSIGENSSERKLATSRYWVIATKGDWWSSMMSFWDGTRMKRSRRLTRMGCGCNDERWEVMGNPVEEAVNLQRGSEIEWKKQGKRERERVRIGVSPFISSVTASGCCAFLRN